MSNHEGCILIGKDRVSLISICIAVYGKRAFKKIGKVTSSEGSSRRTTIFSMINSLVILVSSYNWLLILKTKRELFPLCLHRNPDSEFRLSSIFFTSNSKWLDVSSMSVKNRGYSLWPIMMVSLSLSGRTRTIRISSSNLPALERLVSSSWLLGIRTTKARSVLGWRRLSVRSSTVCVTTISATEFTNSTRFWYLSSAYEVSGRKKIILIWIFPPCIQIEYGLWLYIKAREVPSCL